MSSRRRSGKKGVQALIIENALPEIETQANELLERMTHGGMQLRLITQKPRSGGRAATAAESAIETLDIVISDDLGTRPYELYSGGEAFRINFALRIALSRLLANRSGAPLQTLILDEGFGDAGPAGPRGDHRHDQRRLRQLRPDPGHHPHR